MASKVTKLKELFCLNLLWLICSVPIITIGASTTAMYYVAMKSHRGEEVNLTKDFFKSFKQNFGEATVIWVIIAAVGAAIGFFGYKALKMTGNFSTVAEVITFIVVFLYAMTIIYVFPILARYDNPVFKTIRFSFAVASVSIANTVITIIWWIAVAASVYFLPYMAILWLLIGNILIADYTAKTCCEVFANVIKTGE